MRDGGKVEFIWFVPKIIDNVYVNVSIIFDNKRILNSQRKPWFESITPVPVDGTAVAVIAVVNLCAFRRRSWESPEYE